MSAYRLMKRVVFVGLLVAVIQTGVSWGQERIINLAPGGFSIISASEQEELGLTGNITVRIADQNIATVLPPEECGNQIIIVPKGPGQTSMFLCDDEGAFVGYTINVSTSPVAQQAQKILAHLPSVSVTTVGDKVVAKGVVTSQEDMKTVTDVCTALNIVNLVTKDTTASDDTLRQVLEKQLGLPDVKISVIKGTAVLQGTVPDESTRQLAAEFVKSYFPQTANLLTIRAEKRTTVQAGQITDAIGNPNIKAIAVEDKVRLVGEVLDEVEREQAVEVASTFVGEEKVIDNIVVRAPMVEMDVVIAQINWGDLVDFGDNSLIESLQIDLNSDLSWAQQFGTRSGRDIERGNETLVVPITNAAGAIIGHNVIPVPLDTNIETSGHSQSKDFQANQGITASAQTNLRALVQANCAKIVGRPHVSCRSGDEAYIQLGGSLGVPIVTQNTQGIEYREYGTLVTIRPVVLRNGLISSYIEVERSDEPEPVSFGQSDALNQNRINTRSDIICSQGETVVVSGIITDSRADATSKTPYLNKVPLLNLLFKRETKAVRRTELVVLVTPTVPTIFESDHVPFSKGYSNTLSNANLTGNHLDLSDYTFSRFLFNQTEEWPCRGCRLPTCDRCVAAGLVKTTGGKPSSEVADSTVEPENLASGHEKRAEWTIPDNGLAWDPVPETGVVNRLEGPETPPPLVPVRDGDVWEEPEQTASEQEWIATTGLDVEELKAVDSESSKNP